MTTIPRIKTFNLDRYPVQMRPLRHAINYCRQSDAPLWLMVIECSNGGIDYEYTHAPASVGYTLPMFTRTRPQVSGIVRRVIPIMPLGGFTVVLHEPAHLDHWGDKVAESWSTRRVRCSLDGSLSWCGGNGTFTNRADAVEHAYQCSLAEGHEWHQVPVIPRDGHIDIDTDALLRFAHSKA